MTEYISASVIIKGDSQIYTSFRRWVEVWKPIIDVVGTKYDLYGFDLRHKERFIKDIVHLVDMFGTVELNDLSRDVFDDIIKLNNQVVRSIDTAKRVYEMGCDVNGFNPRLLWEYIDQQFITVNKNDFSNAIKDGVDRQINGDLNALLTQAIKKKDVPQGPQNRVLKEHELPPPTTEPSKRSLNEDVALNDFHPFIDWIHSHTCMIGAVVASIFVLTAIIVRGL